MHGQRITGKEDAALVHERGEVPDFIVASCIEHRAVHVRHDLFVQVAFQRAAEQDDLQSFPSSFSSSGISLMNLSSLHCFRIHLPPPPVWIPTTACPDLFRSSECDYARFCFICGQTHHVFEAIRGSPSIEHMIS